MKSISDILNSMVQPAQQGSLLGGNPSVPSQGSNPSIGSFNDVLSRLSSQNNAFSNTNSGAVSNTSGNNSPANSNTQSTGPSYSSDTQVTLTEVQVSEKVQSTNLSQNDLTNIENAVASMAMALSKLVNLASNLQNLNATQAQNLLVAASGGAISPSQAQQLVAQIADLKNQNSGENALSLTSEQQGALLLQMMQSMVQNQQITLTQSVESQTNQNASLLQFNFGGNSNGQNTGAQTENLSIDIQTFNLQVSNSRPQDLSSNAAQSTNLTDATTQKLTQLLQQLNVTPAGAPVNIQVQSSVAAAHSPELAQNFQNLVQILTQAGAGQAVLNTYLTQNQNNGANNNNSTQTLNQLSQTQNATVVQAAAVAAAGGAGSPNGTPNSGQNDSLAGENQLLNNSLASLNSQLPVQNNTQVQPAALAINVQVPAGSAGVDAAKTAPVQPAVEALNVHVSQTSLAANAASNIQGQPASNQPQVNAPPTNIPAPQIPATTNAASNTPVQPITNQSTAGPIINIQASQASLTVGSPLNVPAQSEANQQLTNTPVTNTQGSQAAVAANVTPQTLVESIAYQPQATVVTNGPNIPAPVTTNTVQNTQVQGIDHQPQSVMPVNTQTVQPTASGQNAQNQAGFNSGNQTGSSMPEEVLTGGQLEALNGIVARFNSDVVSGQAVNANAINNKNNINQFPTETQALNQTVPVPATAPIQNLEPAPPIVNVENTVLNDQNTQQANNLTANNVQNQLTQPTSPITQQVTNTIDESAQNAFAQTAVNTTANNNVGTTTVASTGLTANNNNLPAANANPQTPVASSETSVQQVVTANQGTVPVVIPSSANVSNAAVSEAVSGPVVTQPVTTPDSITAQNVPAATVAGETAKAAVPTQIQSNANSNNNNVQAVPAISSVSAVQPVTSQGVTQVANNSEAAINLNVAGNQDQNASADTANLQNLTAAVNAGLMTNTDKAGNSFQSSVNTVMNNNPNGSVDSAQILNQITQQVASQTADAKMVSRLNFQLIPESLGRVNVQVALVDQSISARITVTNPDVREVLQQHMVDLKAALSQAGLQIDQMQVQVQGGGSNLLAQYYQYQQEGNSYRESAWTPSSNASVQQPANTEDSGVLTLSGSNRLLNLLV